MGGERVVTIRRASLFEWLEEQAGGPAAGLESSSGLGKSEIAD